MTVGLTGAFTWLSVYLATAAKMHCSNYTSWKVSVFQAPANPVSPAFGITQFCLGSLLRSCLDVVCRATPLPCVRIRLRQGDRKQWVWNVTFYSGSATDRERQKQRDRNGWDFLDWGVYLLLCVRPSWAAVYQKGAEGYAMGWDLAKSWCIMNVQRQLSAAAIRAEAKRYEEVKVHLNTVFQLVELVGDPQLKNNIKASLCIVRGMWLWWKCFVSLGSFC